MQLTSVKSCNVLGTLAAFRRLGLRLKEYPNSKEILVVTEAVKADTEVKIF